MTNLPRTTKTLPKTGWLGLQENWRSDLLSGFLVFLMALPLCLGIALASGFPPAAGIITAVIGGLVVSRINGSFVTINGPAAGLIVVVYAAVQSLGDGDVVAGYRYTLAAIVIASLLQVALGVFKAARFSAYFPAAVVHGMLAAIGIIIIAKQSHVMLGVTPEPGSLFSTIAQIPHSLLNPNPAIAVIGFSGLAVLILWPYVKSPRLRMVPAPLVVLISGILLGQIFGIQREHLHLIPTAEHEHLIGREFLVDLPENFLSSFTFPDFSKFFTLTFWTTVISLCLVGSLESMLSTTAVDRLDPYKRRSDLDKDLTAVGIGNIIAGMIGGLPMIAEIVRSSANVNNGARTGWSNFFHGMIMLLFVAFLPHLINSVPLTTLAVLLVYTGYRLASPQSFRKVLDIGVEQLVLFIITIIGVLATDLLMGVVIGILVKLAIHFARGVWPENMFRIHFTDSYLIDHTVMDFIHEFSEQYQEQGGHCSEIGHALETFSDHKLAARLMTEDDRKRQD